VPAFPRKGRLSPFKFLIHYVWETYSSAAPDGAKALMQETLEMRFDLFKMIAPNAPERVPLKVRTGKAFAVFVFSLVEISANALPLPTIVK